MAEVFPRDPRGVEKLPDTRGYKGYWVERISLGPGSLGSYFGAVSGTLTCQQGRIVDPVNARVPTLGCDHVTLRSEIHCGLLCSVEYFTSANRHERREKTWIEGPFAGVWGGC